MPGRSSMGCRLQVTAPSAVPTGMIWDGAG